MNNYFEKYKKYKEKYLSTKNNSFINNLLWRRAEKHFTEGYIDVSSIEKAIINAPSSYGLQPYQILKITELSTKEKVREACFNQSQIMECHTLYIFCALKDLEKRIDEYIKQTNFDFKKESMLKYIKNKNKVPDQIEWAKQQAYLALGFGIASATELKIASCPMEGFDNEKLANVLNLDDNLVPCVLFAVGQKNNNYELEKRFRFNDLIKKID